MVAEDSGSAYVFGFSAATEAWTQSQKLTATDASAGAGFGCIVAIDGPRAVIGALWASNRAGAAYVFDYSSSAGAWSETQKLTAADGAFGDLFGVSADVDGGRIVVGAPYDTDAGPNSGSAYAFEYSATTGSWTQTQKLTASDAARDDYYGWSVGISADRIAVGAFAEDAGVANQGSVYVYTWNATSASWGRSPTPPPRPP